LLRDEILALQRKNRDLLRVIEPFQRENRIQHFIGDIPELQHFPENAIQQGNRIDRGGWADVYTGYIENAPKRIIIKRAIKT
jgi:proline dehydrogenase